MPYHNNIKTIKNQIESLEVTYISWSKNEIKICLQGGKIKLSLQILNTEAYGS